MCANVMRGYPKGNTYIHFQQTILTVTKFSIRVLVSGLDSRDQEIAMSRRVRALHAMPSGLRGDEKQQGRYPAPWKER